MDRTWHSKKFDSTYAEFICNSAFEFGGPEYYSRYRSRYKTCIKRFHELAPPHPVDVLDVGGGSLALLCNKLWGDRACVADLDGAHLKYMRSQGVETVQWNLCKSEQPFWEKFDFIFFSEVIEHLPLPGHIVLERLRKALKPGGIIICTTPNFYRLRNVVFIILGLKIHDYFRVPENESLEHVIEYSRDHLQWQFGRAGFKSCTIEYCQMHHSPTNPVFRVISWLGYPLFLFPRFRDNLLAIAHAP